MAEVVWSEQAVAHVHAIVAHIAQFNRAAAGSLGARLTRLGDSLVELPNRGRPVGDGVRELVTVRPYIVRYRVLTSAS